MCAESQTCGAVNKSQESTPGPWRVFRYQDNGQIEVGTNQRKVLVTTWECLPEDVANANLVAAAPDLLEQLIHARAFIPKNQPRLRESVNAAIAKAEGRS